MAGAVAERAAKPGKGQSGRRRPKRRLGIRIDMTPMVDIAFLLLIFYMVSTVFAMPQAMEITLPPKNAEEETIEIAESNLLTIRVDSLGRYWWNIGKAAENLPELLPSRKEKPDSVAYAFNEDTLRNLLVAKNRANAKLSTLVLIHPLANYGDMVNILDEIDVLERSWNDFTAKQKGIEVEDLMAGDKFSYRYATGVWEDRDSRVTDEAVNQARAQGKLVGF